MMITDEERSFVMNICGSSSYPMTLAYIEGVRASGNYDLVFPSKIIDYSIHFGTTKLTKNIITTKKEEIFKKVLKFYLGKYFPTDLCNLLIEYVDIRLFEIYWEKLEDMDRRHKLIIKEKDKDHILWLKPKFDLELEYSLMKYRMGQIKEFEGLPKLGEKLILFDYEFKDTNIAKQIGLEWQIK